MFKYIAIGMSGLVILGMAGITSHYKGKMDDWAYAESDAVLAFYRHSPDEGDAILREAVKYCLEDAAGGYVPSYAIDYSFRPFSDGLRHAADNDIDSMTDPRVAEFAYHSPEEAARAAAYVRKRIPSQSQETQERLSRLYAMSAGEQLDISACIYRQTFTMLPSN